jgi:hypothetical protein
MSLYQLTPSFIEAFVRLAQTREQGCVVVYNAEDAVHVFVQSGIVVGASGGKREGEAALDHAFEMQNSFYGWMPGAEPRKKNLEIDMQEYLHKHSIKKNQNFGKTIRMGPSIERRQRKLETNYFFVPEDLPTVKLKVKKVTNVVGREGTCDVFVESNQVSRRHCLLQVTERGLLVKDLESTNGTFVNGIPMTDGYINDGDRLSLGTYVLILHRENS